MSTLAILVHLLGCSGGTHGDVEEAAPAISIRPRVDDGCTRDEDCPDLEHCFPPGVPLCGGADREPAHCPPDRPHWIVEGCSERCSAEPPRSCRDGFQCAHGAVCRPDAPGCDAHGCIHLECRSDADCDDGRCVSGRCYDRAGRCEAMPARSESGPAASTARPAPTCPDDQYEVERCITGGMAFQTPDGPRANRSCTTTCSPTPPTGPPGMPCAEVAPHRFVCNAFAP